MAKNEELKDVMKVGLNPYSPFIKLLCSLACQDLKASPLRAFLTTIGDIMKKSNRIRPDDGEGEGLFDYNLTGEGFAYIRKQAGLIQLDIAKQCNRRSRQAIGRYENDKIIPMWLIDVLRMLVPPELFVNARKRFAEGDRL